jgi:tetratricopeptide (TPR) repeat protein
MLRRGDLDGAAAAYAQILESDPEDWTSMNALGDVELRRGQPAYAVAHFLRAADHFREEGFMSKAVALYRKVLRVRQDDSAMLSLGEIAARQGRLDEAKQVLLELARVRRERGDVDGSDDVLSSLQSVIEAEPASAGPPSTPAATLSDGATVEPALPMDESHAERPVEEPGRLELEATAPVQEVASPGTLTEAIRPEGPEPTRPTRARPGKGRPVRIAPSLQSVFDRMRQAAEQEASVAAAHEQFDRAQYFLRDGHDDQAVAALRQAAQAPVVRFKAAAQLGRLLLSRGLVKEAIEWLERAAELPPVSPDEGYAVLYELADALERDGEPSRALAVLIELSSRFRRYRDVPDRIARLSARQDGGSEA